MNKNILLLLAVLIGAFALAHAMPLAQSQSVPSNPTVSIIVTGPQSGNVYYAGDSFTVAINGAPNAAVNVIEDGGVPFYYGNTDSNGIWTNNGYWSSNEIGSYTETWYVAGVATSTISFSVLPIPTPTVSLIVTGPQSGNVYYAGDSFTVAINGAPNAAVNVIEDGGVPFYYGNTDSNGIWTNNGYWSSNEIGSYTETWYVAGVATSTISFSVLPIPTPTVSLIVTGPQSGNVYYAGDSFTVAINGAPNAAVNVIEDGGVPFYYGNTDSNGIWTNNGYWSSNEIGSYTETWYVAGVATSTISFSVLALPASTTITTSISTSTTTSTASTTVSTSTTTSTTSTIIPSADNSLALTILPSNSILDGGEYEAYTFTVTGGVGPFIAWVYNATGGKVQGGNVVIAAPGGNAKITFLVASPTPGNAFKFNGIVIDTGSVPQYTFNSVSNVITVNNALAFVSLQATENTIKLGQALPITATVAGGTPPYTYNFVITDLNTGAASSVASAGIPLAYNSFEFSPASAGLYSIDAIVTDSATAPNTVIDPLIVNVINQQPLVVTPSNALLDAGQYETYTITVNNGIGPFNVELYSLTGLSQQGRNVIINAPGGSNTVSFTENSLGDFTFNAIATDIGNANSVFNSISSTIDVNGNAPVVSLVASGNTPGSGSAETYTITVNGGIGPFSVELYNATGSTAQGSNAIIPMAGGSNTISFLTSAPGAFTYYAIATDTGSSAEYTFNSISSGIVVSAPPASASSGSSGGGGGGGGGGGSGGGVGGLGPAVTAAGNSCYMATPVAWLDSFNVNFNNSTAVIHVVDNFISPNQTGVSIGSQAYTLSENMPQDISGTDATIELANVSYLPIQHTVTLTLCKLSGTNSAQTKGVNSTVTGNQTTIQNSTTKSITVQGVPSTTLLSTTTIPVSNSVVSKTSNSSQKTLLIGRHPITTNIWLLIAALIVLIFLVLLLILAYRRRKRKKGDGKTETGDGQVKTAE